MKKVRKTLLMSITLALFSQAYSQTVFTITELENLCSNDQSYFQRIITSKGFRPSSEFTQRESDEGYMKKIGKTNDYEILLQSNAANSESTITITTTLNILNSIKQSAVLKGYKLEGNKTRDDGTKEEYFVKGYFLYEILFIRNSNTNTFTINFSKPNIVAEQIKSQTIQINSRTKTTDIYIKKNDKVYLRASGEIVLGPWAGAGGPEGIDGYTSYNKVGGFRHGSLLAKIGDGEYFFVGTYKVITAQTSGVLKLIINDDDPSNNSGSFIIEYSINKEIKPMTANIQAETPKVEPEKPNLKSEEECLNKSLRSHIELGRMIGSIPKEYSGTMTNTTIQKTASCKMEIGWEKTSSYNKKYRLTGSVDNINLIGKWDLVSDKKIEVDCTAMLEFSGEVDFGYGGTGFPKGTKAPITVRIEITKDYMKGTYTVGAFGGRNEQQGVFDLR